MPATTSLLQTLKRDFTDITFKKGDAFRWAPGERTVYYANLADSASLLHEVAHAALGHSSYTNDIELLHMERDAWDYTLSVLSKRYGVDISDERAEDMLESYKDWLHSRSLCPHCEATGIQIGPRQYSCLACSGSWRVNEARVCALRRYTQK